MLELSKPLSITFYTNYLYSGLNSIELVQTSHYSRSLIPRDLCFIMQDKTELPAGTSNIRCHSNSKNYFVCRTGNFLKSVKKFTFKYPSPYHIQRWISSLLTSRDYSDLFLSRIFLLLPELLKGYSSSTVYWGPQKNSKTKMKQNKQTKF